VEPRARDLAEGFAAACLQSGAVWGGGETPALKGIVNDDAVVLAGSAFGAIKPKSLRIMGDVQEGDAIVLLASSGIHANGLSLARKLTERLPQGYLTPLANGQTYGEALLAPTTLYSPVTEALYKAGITPHYCANITGHGWRKLLRHPAELTYRISQIPPVPRVLSFIADHAGHDAREAYSTFNMGAGFALFVAAGDAQRTADVARAQGIEAWVAGTVEAGPKQLVIEPLALTFAGDALQLR
jgi:phosphoribosylformylglycinamidine cyclo-ligase